MRSFWRRPARRRMAALAIRVYHEMCSIGPVCTENARARVRISRSAREAQRSFRVKDIARTMMDQAIGDTSEPICFSRLHTEDQPFGKDEAARVKSRFSIMR